MTIGGLASTWNKIARDKTHRATRADAADRYRARFASPFAWHAFNRYPAVYSSLPARSLSRAGIVPAQTRFLRSSQLLPAGVYSYITSERRSVASAWKNPGNAFHGRNASGSLGGFVCRRLYLSSVRTSAIRAGTRARALVDADNETSGVIQGISRSADACKIKARSPIALADTNISNEIWFFNARGCWHARELILRLYIAAHL